MDIEPFTATKDTKLTGIEESAKDDQTGAEIKTAYQAEANAYTDVKNTKLAGVETGATKYPDTGEQAFLDGDHTKLNGIDTGAKDDQTGAEIKTAYQAEANAYTDAKNTKLTGVDDGADVTGSNPPQAHGASVHADRTRRVWLTQPSYVTGTEDKYGSKLDPNAVEMLSYKFMLPKDFVSVNNMYIYYYANVGSNNIVIDLMSYYATVGEAKTAHTGMDLDNVIAVSDTNIHRFTTVGLLTNATADDVVVFTIERDADHAEDTCIGEFIVMGVLIEYTADM